MTTTEHSRLKALLAGVLLALGSTGTGVAEGPVAAGSSRDNPIAAWMFGTVDPALVAPVTSRDVLESNAKVEMAYAALATMWNGHFESIGEAFAVPRLLRYRGTVRTSCGVMPQNNAVYCPSRNAIYFDEIFLAGMAKRVGGELGTDGDMAAVGVIAHEVGHAVAMQLGHASRFTYENESVADCLAGAFTLESEKNGHLEKGDLEEAFLGMALAGDPESASAASGASSERDRRRAALMSHGTREQRMENFRSGLDGGAAACLPHFGAR